MNRGFILQGPVWTYFGYGVGQHRDCESCASEFRRTGVPPAAAHDCWKLEIWLGEGSAGDSLVEALMDAARRDRRLMGKVSTHPVPREDSGTFERVAYVYFPDRPSAERFAEWIAAMAPAGRWRPIVRKGCRHFEVLAGPWQSWKE